MFGITPSDRIYDTLPLYHSAGGVLGIGQMIVRGCTIIVRPKFSASQYWTDCIKYQATVSNSVAIRNILLFFMFLVANAVSTPAPVVGFVQFVSLD